MLKEVSFKYLCFFKAILYIFINRLHLFYSLYFLVIIGKSIIISTLFICLEGSFLWRGCGHIYFNSRNVLCTLYKFIVETIVYSVVFFKINITIFESQQFEYTYFSLKFKFQKNGQHYNMDDDWVYKLNH